jgi:prevent-host-death family protein
MKNISTAEARTSFAHILNRAAYGGERVVVERRGKAMAAVVPIDDLIYIRAMEDRIDNEDVDARLREMKKRGDKPIPWEQVKRELGL